MRLITSLQQMQKLARAWRQKGKRVGFVPTMGALHAGHLSLIKTSIKHNDITVVSIFVNPIQFGPREDYQKYPKNLRKDLTLLEPLRVDAVFAPETRDVFPSGIQTSVDVKNLSKPLEGEFRPGHFRGVATVVLKLFHLVLPSRAYFGEKDRQQLLVVRQMVQDLNMDVEIIGCPIVRDKNGLALSSRNQYLTPRQRQEAPTLHAALLRGKEAIEEGVTEPKKVERIMQQTLSKISNAKIDYVVARNPNNLQPIKRISGETLLLLAVRIGTTRLLDNLLVRDHIPS